MGQRSPLLRATYFARTLIAAEALAGKALAEALDWNARFVTACRELAESQRKRPPWETAVTRSSETAP